MVLKEIKGYVKAQRMKREQRDIKRLRERRIEAERRAKLSKVRMSELGRIEKARGVLKSEDKLSHRIEKSAKFAAGEFKGLIGEIGKVAKRWEDMPSLVDGKRPSKRKKYPKYKGSIL